MEILQLKYFIAAGREQSFTAAARKYGVPVSDISQTIKRLEKELGVQLFLRSANRVSLSPQGALFLSGANRAMEELEEAARLVKEREDTVCGEIRLLVLTNRRVVTQAIEKFRTLYPEVSFNISHTDGGDGEFDIIISDEKPRKGSYEERELLEEKFLLAVAKGSEPQGFDVSAPSLSVFSKTIFISMPENSSMYRATRKICADLGFIPNIGIKCDDPFYLRKYVEMGLGAALVPSFSWQGQISDKIALYDIGDFRRRTCLYLSKSRCANRAVREFLPLLEKEF